MLAITSIRGLPAHPLFAHVPVVLIPLAAIGAVAMLWPSIRDRIGWVVVGAVFVAGIFSQLTISAGQSLKQYVPRTELLSKHVHMGEEIRPWVLLMFLALLGVMLVARRARQRAGDDATDGARGGRDTLKIAGIAAAVLSIVFSVVATYSIYRIGDSGAKAVWAKTQVKIDKGQSTERGENGR